MSEPYDPISRSPKGIFTPDHRFTPSCCAARRKLCVCKSSGCEIFFLIFLGCGDLHIGSDWANVKPNNRDGTQVQSNKNGDQGKSKNEKFAFRNSKIQEF